MKKLAALIVVLLLPTFALASVPSKIGFRAISSAYSVTCGVFGQGAKLRREIQDSRISAAPIQGFAPDPTKSRIYTLGTKGFANYSTNGLIAARWTCNITGTTATNNVKVFMDGVETYFLTTSGDTFIMGQ